MGETKTLKIEGRKIDLPHGRSVFVGQIEGSTDLFIQLKNGTAIQRFRLSQEGGTALVDLIDHDNRGLPDRYIIELESEERQMRRWQVVKELDA